MNPKSGEEYFYKIENLLYSSCQHLRNVFASRWKEETGKGWGSTETQGRQVTEGLGERIYNSLQPQQKTVIETGALSEWDLPTLSLILQHCRKLKNLPKVESDGVKTLSRLRNELNNNSKKKLTREEYNQKLGVFRTSLQNLKLEEKRIKKIIASAGVTSSTSATEVAKNLLETAKVQMKEQEFKKAIETLEQVVEIPSLLQEHLSRAIEKRSECHLKTAQNLTGGDEERVKLLEKAATDAQNALELNLCSWKAHQVLGEYYKEQDNLKEAICHYEQALAISPAQQQLEIVLNSLKALHITKLAEENIKDHDSSFNLPINGAREKLFDLKIGEPTEESAEGASSAPIIGQHEVDRGDKFKADGKLTEAIRCYRQGAELGNPYAICELASCYHKGIGVEKDLRKAHELYLQVAKMPPTTPGHIRTKMRANAAVAISQQAVGLMYELGIGVEQNYSKSANWYTKAAENGSDLAANNLGIFYNYGKGVPRGEKMGAKYMNLAVTLGAKNATHALMFYYIENMEPEKARAMLNKGRELLFSPLLGVSEKHFRILLKTCCPYDRTEHEEDVLAFEKKHKLGIEGMTFLERLERKLNFKEGMTTGNGGGNNSTKILQTEADRLKATIKDFGRLAHFFREERPLTDDEENEVVDIMYRGAMYEYDAFTIPTMISNRLKSLFVKLYSEKCEKKERVERDKNDMKIRYVYFTFIQRETQGDADCRNLLKLAKKGLEMYPDNAEYYALVSRLYTLLRDNQAGLRYAEQGLEKFGTHAGLLQLRATNLYHLLGDSDADTKKFIRAYKDFLREVPFDHWQTPKIFYLMAQRYINEGASRHDARKARNARRMVRYYHWLGDSAEAHVHSYFKQQAAAVTPIKKMIEMFLSKFNGEDGATL